MIMPLIHGRKDVYGNVHLVVVIVKVFQVVGLAFFVILVGCQMNCNQGGEFISFRNKFGTK
jgi:hypothetical protein